MSDLAQTAKDVIGSGEVGVFEALIPLAIHGDWKKLGFTFDGVEAHIFGALLQFGPDITMFAFGRKDLGQDSIYGVGADIVEVTLYFAPHINQKNFSQPPLSSTEARIAKAVFESAPNVSEVVLEYTTGRYKFGRRGHFGHDQESRSERFNHRIGLEIYFCMCLYILAFSLYVVGPLRILFNAFAL